MKKPTQYYVEFEVLVAVTVKNTVFCIVTSCSSERTQRFGGTYRLYLHSRKVSQ
jgi:hypothetical protein